MKSFFQSLLLVFAVTLITVLVSEFALALVYPQKTLFPRYVDSAEYPIELPANSRLVNAQGSLWEFVYNTNELGRRGPYFPPSENYDTTNVVVLGDSFSFGIGVNDDEVFSQKMSEQLGSEYAVINGGMGGWGIDSEIKWFYSVGMPYKPKYVVLQFTSNDLYDSHTGVTKIEGEEFKFYPYDVKRPAWQLFISDSSVLQTSHLYSLVRTAFDRINAPAASVDKGSENHAKKKKGEANNRQLYYLKFLELFAQKLNQQGVELIFVSVTHQSKDKGYRYDIDKFDLIKQVVERLDTSGALHYVQLPLDEMEKGLVSPEGHQWSAMHHKLVGQALADTIIKLE